MRLLLDTHALIWFARGDPRTPAPIRDVIADPANEIYVSAVSAMEIATKVRKGKLAEAELLIDRLEDTLEQLDILQLAITVRQARRAGTFAGDHADPFDRLLAAQAIDQELTLVSNDAAVDQFGVTRIW